MQTPWGPAQSIDKIADGILCVSTASHGGIILSPERNAKVPDYMRDRDGHYEEDCEYAIPFVVFEAEIRAWAKANGDRIMDAAKRSLANWNPDAFEKFFGVKLTPEQSHIRREESFEAAHANDWIGLAAWGDWAVGVPAGMVGVFASVGGRRSGSNIDGKHFLVPADEYKKREIFGFVVDPARHQEIPAGQITGRGKNDAR